MADIPKSLRNTPVGELLMYHNLGKPFKNTTAPGCWSAYAWTTANS